MTHTFEIDMGQNPRVIYSWCWKNLYHKWTIDRLEALSTPEQEVRSKLSGIPLKRFLSSLPRRYIVTICDDSDALLFKLRWT